MNAPTQDTTTVAVFFGVYTIGIVLVGVYAAKYARRNDEDYFLAGRSLGGWVAALSASASSESAWVTLGLVGWAYQAGAQAYWIIPGCLLGFLFNWFVLAGRIRSRATEVNALTLPDLFSNHFNERWPVLRILSVIVILVAMLLYVAAQLAAAGQAFAVTFNGIDYRVGVVVGAAVVLTYTVLGGFRAVCWTDFLQGLLMVGTLVVFPIYLLIEHGGYDFIQTNVAQPEYLTLAPQATGMALLGFLLGHGALGINLGYPGQPHVLVRFMALRSKRDALIGGIVSTAWGACVYWGAVTIGLMARALAESGAGWASEMLADPQAYQELGLLLSAKHLLPGMFSGMVLAAVLAAICSTADSQLVVAASAAANDLFARLFKRNNQGTSNAVNRIMVFVLGLIAMVMVIDSEVRVYQFVLDYGWAILGAAFGPQIMLLVLWRRASWIGCVGGMLTGFCVAILWKQKFNNVLTINDQTIEVYNLTLAFGMALIVNIVLSLCSRQPKSSS